MKSSKLQSQILLANANNSSLQRRIKKDKGMSDEPFNKRYVDMKFARHMIITIPSTQGHKPISDIQLQQRANRVATDMTEKFGGSTRIRGHGQYRGSGKHRFDEEDVIQVDVFMTEKDWNARKRGMSTYLHKKRKDWNQQSLGVEFDSAEKMYLIK